MDKDTFTKKVLDAETTLYRMAKTILIQDADCEDAVQEAIIKAYESIDSLREESYFKTWLVRILINECYNIQNKRIASVPYEDYFQDEPDLSEMYDPTLQHCLLSLPEKIRVTMVLYYIEGYSVKEIGDILHVPGGTVKSRMSKGRTMLRRKLDMLEVDYEAI